MGCLIASYDTYITMIYLLVASGQRIASARSINSVLIVGIAYDASI
jgi:hypothetical protein